MSGYFNQDDGSGSSDSARKFPDTLIPPEKLNKLRSGRNVQTFLYFSGGKRNEDEQECKGSTGGKDGRYIC